MATRQNFEKLLDSPNVQKMLNLIANAEGVQHGYNTLFGNEKFSDLSKHPNVSKEFTQTDGKKNRTNAAGRYQFLKQTWDGVAKQLGLEDFSPKNQDIAAVALLAQNGALPSVLKGDFNTAIQKSGGTWASLPSAPSKYKQPKKTWEEIGLNNPARDQYQNRSDQIVAAYKAKQVKAEQQDQPKVDAARSQRIIAAYQQARQNGQVQDKANQPQGLPDFDAQGVLVEPTNQPTQAKPEPSLGDRLLGAGETALSLGTGLTTGTAGLIGGAVQGLGQEVLSGQFGTPEAARRVEQRAADYADRLTYSPRTEVGQQYAQATGEALAPLVALSPATAEIGLAAQAARAANPIAQGAAIQAGRAISDTAQQAARAAQRPIQATSNAVRSGVDSLRDLTGLNRVDNSGTAPANIGAAQVDPATIRQAMSQDLPYPVDLTEGQMSRDPSQLKFEVETSKDPRLGDPLRQRYEDQHQVMQHNIDAFIDSTGSQATNMREVGLAVDSALQKQLQADKNRVRVAYNKADKSPEAQTPVDLAVSINNGGNPTTILDYLNSQPDLPTTPILSTAKRTAESIGIAQRDANGNLVSKNPTIKQMETWRQEINANTNNEAPNIRQASILKGMIDEHVGPVEGTLYKAARNERVRMGQRWEKTAIMQDLTKKKQNSNDRIVALEDVQKRIIHDGSLDDLRTARRTLLTSGDEGKQAWKDIQGQTLQEIKNAATAGVAPDARGNQMISPAALNKAIKRLDDSGKLDFIFGQQGAEKLRALNDISKTLFTVPASAGVNHSNTAATLLAAIDITMSGLSGFPAPVASALRIATKHIKDNKTRARVQKALNPTPRNP
ncbi:glycoside hydrolase family 104 protein [Acinetobacter sp. ANC 3882]|uniref:glycoside hydrolase family 24 protein n=1 Tax=Acinetobacter sp. ANC 3882 TaxID=2923423 RepID=UPI001F4A5AA2|nr:glycoside hydrolase family 104 protein [Acinetobacter sp. ANC 3882]MCH7312914.1 glycoside hydrolase family 104 protein [Acinetobacter sp. ANC 3882]